VGEILGNMDGITLGCKDGTSLGISLGCKDGTALGAKDSLGMVDGIKEDVGEPDLVGFNETLGDKLGTLDKLGTPLGKFEGSTLGITLGIELG